MSTYLVFGGTGNVGRRVVERLAQAGAAVRATSRRPRTAGLPTGVEVVTPDLDAPRALDGVEGAYGSLKTVPIHEDDIAAVAVHALAEDGHAGRRYALTGPEVLTQEEQVQIIGEAIGRPLRWHELTREEERARLLADPGFPDAFVDELLDGYATLIAAPPPAVTTTVPDITGAPATPLTAWAAEHAAGFGGDPR